MVGSGRVNNIEVNKMAYEKQTAAAKKKLNATKDRAKWNSRVPDKRYKAGLDDDAKKGTTTINSRAANGKKATAERKKALAIRNKQKIIARAAARAKKVAPKTKSIVKKKK